MSGTLENKVALITGTGGGQGRAAALRFAAEGAIVFGCDVNAEASAATVEAVEKAGGKIEATAPVDLGDPQAAQQWVERSGEVHGRIDVLYNNASAARFEPVDTMSIENWQFTIRNELDLVFYVTKYAWPYLARNGGVIISTASQAGHVGSKAAPELAHCATKAAVIGMTRQLAVEGAPVGIRAVSISPGVIETPGTAEMLKDPKFFEMVVGGNLVPRVGKPDDVIALAAFLASDAASYITGSDFLVDGGASAYA